MMWYWLTILIPLVILGLYTGGMWVKRGKLPETLSGSYYKLGSKWRWLFTGTLGVLGLSLILIGMVVLPPTQFAYSWLLVLCGVGSFIIGLGPKVGLKYERLVYAVCALVIIICSQCWLYLMHGVLIMAIPWVIMTLYFLFTKAVKWVLLAEIIIVLSLFLSIIAIFGF